MDPSPYRIFLSPGGLKKGNKIKARAGLKRFYKALQFAFKCFLSPGRQAAIVPVVHIVVQPGTKPAVQTSR